jgi:hypothetical protein
VIRARGTRELKARAGLGLGVIAALAIAIWAAVSRGNGDPPPTTASTTTVATTATTTSTTIASTTSTTAATTTTPAETTVDPEARVEEVRQILQDLYYGWFLAIYNQDEETVRQVIATQRYLDDFRRAIAEVDYPRAPTQEDVVVTDLEILRDSNECLVTYSTIDVSRWLGDGASVTSVNVLLPVHGEWRFGTAWMYRDDLWQQDCEIEPDL